MERNRYEFAELLAIAHERLVLLDDLKSANMSLAYMQGVATGVIGAAIVILGGWWLWHIF